MVQLDGRFPKPIARRLNEGIKSHAKGWVSRPPANVDQTRSIEIDYRHLRGYSYSLFRISRLHFGSYIRAVIGQEAPCRVNNSSTSPPGVEISRDHSPKSNRLTRRNEVSFQS